MPIIPRVGRKALRIRLLLAVVYTVLTLGAVTMVYPFLLMLATSVTSSTDTNEFRVVPRYLYDAAPLFAKHVDEKYAGEIERVNAMYHTDFRKLDVAAPPASMERSRKLVEEWNRFVCTLPDSDKAAGFRGYGFHPNLLARLYRSFVRDRFGGDIQALNRTYTEENENFETVVPPIEHADKRNWSPDSSPKVRDFLAWKARLSDEYKPIVSIEALWAQFLREDAPAYGGDVRRAAAVWGRRRSFDEIPLSCTPPANASQRRDWERFVRTKMPFRCLTLAPAAIPTYRQFLRVRYGVLDRLNRAYGAAYRAWDDIGLPIATPAGGPANADWSEYLSKAAPLSAMRVDSPENRFRAFLAAKYRIPANGSYQSSPASLSELNRDLGTTYASLLDIQPPFYAADALYVYDNAASLRRAYLGRNYAIVLDYILLHGRSLFVTAVFCALVILTTLIVNPLCAYALSRFPLSYAYRVLLFVLATMAFPAEVAMIPNFLLLKQLGLLNTYWALILPGMASGFSIFLLKGFFDSLPRELYEAGTIDGASEARMFVNLTIPLSKPIFAVIALNAFTAAYGAFMFALLVCQNPRMWTLMVWLYELQIANPQYVMMAGLAVAAVPTLLVFIFAQNVIMRGIILPSEK